MAVGSSRLAVPSARGDGQYARTKRKDCGGKEKKEGKTEILKRYEGDAVVEGAEGAGNQIATVVVGLREMLAAGNWKRRGR